MAESGTGNQASGKPAASYQNTHDLLFARDGRKVKTHREVEAVLRKYNWRPTSDSAVNGWVDYRYEPPNNPDDIKPMARLPAPSLNNATDWKLAFFLASLVCVQEFAAQVNKVTEEEIFVVVEKQFTW